MWNKTTQGENLIIIKRRAMFDFQMILKKNTKKNNINFSLNPRKRCPLVQSPTNIGWVGELSFGKKGVEKLLSARRTLVGMPGWSSLVMVTMMMVVMVVGIPGWSNSG